MSLNKVTLIGNIGHTPEIKTTKDGKEFATFSLATNNSYIDKSGARQNNTTWHSVVVYSQGLARVVKNYCTKGAKIYIEGELSYRDYTGRDGQKKKKTEIILNGYSCALQLLNSKNNDQAEVSKPNTDNATPGQTSKSINLTDNQQPVASMNAFDNQDYAMDEIPF